ncbi:hypothetical protein [Paenibacillus ehimensis]|uniref:hypothetical protein n=1 Tax=Paenibacillus ehimensis TaxID=79264 RepID=UPI0004700C85|nr:hypothetical protein [Paenibacillus ehimensis]
MQVENWIVEETTPRVLTVAELTPKGPSSYCRFRIGITPDNPKETFILIGRHANMDELHPLIKAEVDRWMKGKCEEFGIEGEWTHQRFIAPA